MKKYINEDTQDTWSGDIRVMVRITTGTVHESFIDKLVTYYRDRYLPYVFHHPISFGIESVSDNSTGTRSGTKKEGSQWSRHCTPYWFEWTVQTTVLELFIFNGFSKFRDRPYHFYKVCTLDNCHSKVTSNFKKNRKESEL